MDDTGGKSDLHVSKIDIHPQNSDLQCDYKNQTPVIPKY